MDINLHIERVVLDGVDIGRHERPLLLAAIQSELSHLLVTQSLAPGNLAQARLVTDPIQLADAPQPAQLGRQIATAVYQGVNR